ncbi:MAG: nucleotidyltransferase family protein [Bacteroidota bacterium]
MPNTIAALVIAAGASKRMPNQIKQLLPWKNSTLLGNSIHQISPLVDTVHIVLGAHADKIKTNLPEYAVCHINPNWEKGMGTSIAYGIQQIIKNGLVPNAVIILVPDQPLMDTEYFTTLKNVYLEADDINIVATDYGNQRTGVPALFDQSLFGELQKLEEDYGAKRIIQMNLARTKLIAGSGKEVDVDTYEAYTALVQCMGL